MARGRKKEPEAGGVELNLTPMIDVVFNLIVFFMIVTDLAQREIDEVSLPRSETAVADASENGRVIVNILRGETGEEVRVRVKGRDYDSESLRVLLFSSAERLREADGFASQVPVLIRADERVRWRAVQHVLQACADPAVRIHKVFFATADE